MHHIPPDRQGRFSTCHCKGSDVVIAYRSTPGSKIPGRGVARQPPGRRPAPHRFPSAQALAYVINELDSTLTTYRQDRDSGRRRPADHSVDAIRVHRLQHRRRDLGRSRGPQRLRLQPRPRQHRRVRHRSCKGNADACANGCRPRRHRASSPSTPDQRFPVRRQPGLAARSSATGSAVTVGLADPVAGQGRQPSLHRLQCVSESP